MSSDPKHTITNQYYVLMNIISKDRRTQAHNILNIYTTKLINRHLNF